VSTIWDHAVRALHPILGDRKSLGETITSSLPGGGRSYYCGGPLRACSHLTCALVCALAEANLLGYSRPVDEPVAATGNGARLVHGLAGVPLDSYDAIELLAERTDDEPAQILSAAARAVADQWNDPPSGFAVAAQIIIERDWPELHAVLYELLGGGPCTPPLRLADCRVVEDGPQ
jgi:hypothetical protein